MFFIICFLYGVHLCVAFLCFCDGFCVCFCVYFCLPLPCPPFPSLAFALPLPCLAFAFVWPCIAFAFAWPCLCLCLFFSDLSVSCLCDFCCLYLYFVMRFPLLLQWRLTQRKERTAKTHDRHIKKTHPKATARQGKGNNKAMQRQMQMQWQTQRQMQR